MYLQCLAVFDNLFRTRCTRNDSEDVRILQAPCLRHRLL